MAIEKKCWEDWSVNFQVEQVVYLPAETPVQISKITTDENSINVESTGALISPATPTVEGGWRGSCGVVLGEETNNPVRLGVHLGWRIGQAVPRFREGIYSTELPFRWFDLDEEHQAVAHHLTEWTNTSSNPDGIYGSLNQELNQGGKVQASQLFLALFSTNSNSTNSLTAGVTTLSIEPFGIDMGRPWDTDKRRVTFFESASLTSAFSFSLVYGVNASPDLFVEPGVNALVSLVTYHQTNGSSLSLDAVSGARFSIVGSDLLSGSLGQMTHTGSWPVSLGLTMSL